MLASFFDHLTTADALTELLEELQSRYDGAEDSPTRWMAYYIHMIQAVLAREVR